MANWENSDVQKHTVLSSVFNLNTNVFKNTNNIQIIKNVWKILVKLWVKCVPSKPGSLLQTQFLYSSIES